MKNRPNREPDFVFTNMRRKGSRYESIFYHCYWKERIVIVQCYEEPEYIYDIVQTEFGRIDMVSGNICNCISWVKGLRESYEEFLMEEALLHD